MNIMAACVLVLSTATGIAAASGRRSSASALVYSAASLTARHPVNVRRCDGYTVTRGTFAGRSISIDKRLAGTMVFTGKITSRSGAGVVKGTLTVRDSKQRLRMKGSYRGLVVNGASLRGLVTGTLYRPKESLIGTGSISFDPRFNSAGVRIGVDSFLNAAVTYGPLPKC